MYFSDRIQHTSVAQDAEILGIAEESGRGKLTNKQEPISSLY